MDKDHRLDAPDNESLRTIEQLGNHSELSTIYPHAHNQWEGELISKEEREARRAREQVRINVTIRKWFAVIGALVPLPFILGTAFFTLGLTFVRVDNLVYLMLPIVAAVLVWFYISLRSIKRVYAIFYEHSIKATPFIVILLVLLLLSLQAHYMLVLPLYGDSILLNSLLTSAVSLTTSIVLSGILMLIWTSSRLSSSWKFGFVCIIALGIVIATALLNIP
jgi:membrane-associated HD superfamily phosphohydrolase